MEQRAAARGYPTDDTNHASRNEGAGKEIKQQRMMGRKIEDRKMGSASTIGRKITAKSTARQQR